MLLEDLEALDIEVQRQLVETVEAGRFWRLGGETPIPLDVRLMATSENDLLAAGDRLFDARFVEWISRFAIIMPPLRERIDDLPMLINEALNQIQLRAEGPRKSLDPSAYRALASYHWPGNLRELIAVLERAVVVSPGQVITPDHLPPLDEPEAPVARRLRVRVGEGVGARRPAPQPLSARHDRRLARHLAQDALQQDAALRSVAGQARLA